ncbi:Cache domain-containing protein [Salinimicrobium catena]|uniref:Cache domain-containing protein n=1 Tax=Salinimicrobium catena TaxID=390640 RepID=A0A1H5LF47_9FLAO|nr:cache domain-containing protein [Salinimicrobium catena]SDL09405.1 Cache domain-containing protein [Salinimicrobium catena]SEE75692.1 Cache domain-containing protein [Salinimicrobium catena]
MKTTIVFVLLVGATFFQQNAYSFEQVPDTAKANRSSKQDSAQYLMNLVKDAAEMVKKDGTAAFEEFRKPGSRWRQGETYIFVLDKEGNMLVHTDPEMENKNQLDLKDVNGKPIIRGLLSAASALPDKQEGWFHYQWPTPEGLLPRWKSSFVKAVSSPEGKEYIIGSGMYTDRMEKEFVTHMVDEAVAEIEIKGKAAFKDFYDPAGPFLIKDTYIFVMDTSGVELVNPAFKNLEGRNLMDLKDTENKFLVKEMFKTVKKDTAGWVNYMWPKPGDNLSTQKSAYVKKAQLDDNWVLVGAGVYLADAPKTALKREEITPFDLKNFVTDAAVKLEKEGEKAFPDFRRKESQWFEGDKYLFVWDLDGKRIFHAANPSIEGEVVDGTTDAMDRPYGKMFLETASSPTGEGWVHYVYPEPGDIFPAWKSSYIKKVTFPSGKEHLVGSGIYNMKMDETLIEDMVEQAAALIKEQGRKAFDVLRDKKGPFYFMDTYIFVTSPEGTELVNPAQPTLEGRNLIDLKDLKGDLTVKKEIDLAMDKGSGWLEMTWFKPGTNTPAPKMTFVKKAEANGETFIVGSGYYPDKN